MSRAAASPSPGFASGRYYVCLGLLAATALGTHLGASWLEAYFEKLPLPLKAPLYRMEAAALAPYVLAPAQSPPLSDELVESLGTKEYLDWQLVDPRLQPDDPAYHVRLFITYYTGQPDMVPHEPRECMQAAGWRLVTEDRFELDLVRDGLPCNIPVAILGFEPAGVSEDAPRMHVMYFFSANGQYVTTRTGVRRAVAGLWDKYAYYAKLEVAFTDASRTRFADAETSRAALRRLAPHLMEVLWRDHLPDWGKQ